MTNSNHSPAPRSYLARAISNQVPRKFLRDQYNRIKFGENGPISDECLFMNPNEITRQLIQQNKKLRRQASGRVLDGNWDTSTVSMTQNTKYKSCKMRYLDGVEWVDTPIFQRLEREIASGHIPDDCPTPEALVARYHALDELWETIQKEGRLRPKAEMPQPFRREHGGILVHIDRNGHGIRSGGGMHRFAIAQLANLAFIPVQVGVVHKDFVLSGNYQKLRIPPATASLP